MCYNLVASQAIKMVDYQKMYYILCRAASDALDVLPDAEENQAARSLIQEALFEAEEIYISASDAE